VFTSGGRSVVYKRTRSGFEETPIDILRRGREQIAIKDGLQPGDKLSLTKPEPDGKGGAK
jgi:hypothetical protein